MKLYQTAGDFYARTDPEPAGRDYGRWLLWILFGWTVMWTLLPCCVLTNDFVDVLENVVWGSHWEFGYDKNPYLGAWFGYGFWRLCGKCFFSSFLASLLLVDVGIFSVWSLARRILPARTAFLAAVTLLAFGYYGINAMELRDDVMELGLWPLTMLFSYLGVRGSEKRRIWYWLLAGLFAGASLMVKYFAPALFLSLAIPLAFTREGRKVFRTPAFYLGLLPLLALTIPNLCWLIGHQGQSLEYAAGRAGLAGEIPWSYHLIQPLKAVNRVAGVIGVVLGFFVLLFWCPVKKADRVHYSAFDRVFVTSCCWGAFASALLFSAVTGGKVNYSWLVPCFPCFGIWLFMVWQPRISDRRVKVYAGMLLAMGVVFGILFALRSMERQGYRNRDCDYENLPGKKMAAQAEQIWRREAAGAIPVVIGTRKCACNVAVYSADMPEAFFDADVKQSPWIDLDAVKQSGGILVWEGDASRIPPQLRRIRNRFPAERIGRIETVQLERAVPAWYRNWRGPARQEPYSFQAIRPAVLQ